MPLRLAYSLAIALALCLCGVAPTEARSRAVVAEFKRLQPCPSTGKATGACPGWQVDHVLALCAGGRDEVRNLQWLRVEEHRIKTRSDVLACRRKMPPPLAD
jgi:5-methylcytosine-specific restriction endonuclease McrA